MPDEAPLKLKTARTLKWNSIDKFSSQILYAVVGVVLANILSKEDFGLVGAILVFQAFAILFVDSGFGAALLQKKKPTEADYSTVFWFNLFVSIGIYAILFFCAPLIADIFQGDRRLVPMSRVMFLSFVINGATIVQTNRLMKAMNVKNIAISNLVGLIVSGTVAIVLSLKGYGAWALVWQAVVLASVKCVWLWATGGWLPSLSFSRESFKSIYRVGLGVFSGSFLNTLFLNIYSFVIGAFYSLSSLGVYTQADKWSKMGSASLSQIFTATFVPVLSSAQDDPERFHRYVSRINRFAAFILFPFMGWLIVSAAPIFHTLFGNKWDAAIILFQILCARGIFVVLTSLYNNYLLALGYAKRMVIIEVIKDIITLAAIFATVWFGSVEILVWGQFAAGALTWLAVDLITSRATGYRTAYFLKDCAPYFLLTLAAMAAALVPEFFITAAPLLLIAQAAIGAFVYWIVLKLTDSQELRESKEYVLGRFKRKGSQNQ